MELIEALIAIDEGTLTEDEEVEVYQHLVDTGLAWQLQGRIGRTAADLIAAGLVTVEVRA